MPEVVAAIVPALGQALLHFLWQGLLIGLVAALALRALRDARPQARYLVAGLALSACMLVPMLTVMAKFAAQDPATSAALSAMPAHRSDASPQAVGTAAILGELVRGDAAASWLVAVWAAGAGAMFLRLGLGLAWIRRLRRTPQDDAWASWQIRLDALATRLGLRRRVVLRVVDALQSPVSAGWWRPVVLMPAALLMQMPADLIEALLAHELAHIRRHDYLLNLLQHVVEALLFYHPVTWWLSRRIRCERELVADQMAAELTAAPRRLALALSALSEVPRNDVAPQLAQAAHDGELLPRIRRLVRSGRAAPAAARTVFSLLAMAAACVASWSGAAALARQSTVAIGVPARPDRTDYSAIRLTTALVRRDRGVALYGPDDELTAAAAAKLGVAGDFLWARRNRVDFVITDAALLARAGQAWQEFETLEREHEAVNAAAQAYDRETEALQQRRLAMQDSHTSTPRREWRRQMTALQREQQRLNDAIHVLNQRSEALFRAKHAADGRIHGNLQGLVDDALAQGLARAVPAPS